MCAVTVVPGSTHSGASHSTVSPATAPAKDLASSSAPSPSRSTMLTVATKPYSGRELPSVTKTLGWVMPSGNAIDFEAIVGWPTLAPRVKERTMVPQPPSPP